MNIDWRVIKNILKCLVNFGVGRHTDTTIPESLYKTTTQSSDKKVKHSIYLTISKIFGEGNRQVEDKDCALISYRHFLQVTQLGSKLMMSLKHCPEVEIFFKKIYNIQVPVWVPANQNSKPESSGILVGR